MRRATRTIITIATAIYPPSFSPSIVLCRIKYPITAGIPQIKRLPVKVIKLLIKSTIKKREKF